MVFFFAVWRGRVLFFAVWAGAQAPPKQQNKKNAHAQTANKKNTPPPLPSVFFLLFGRLVVFIFCCLGGWRWIFFAVGGGRVFLFCCLGGWRVLFFAVWVSGGRVLFFAVWAGRVCFLLFGRGTGVHSLTGRPGSSLSDPTTKKTKQQKKKKKHGFRIP